MWIVIWIDYLQLKQCAGTGKRSQKRSEFYLCPRTWTARPSQGSCFRMTTNWLSQRRVCGCCPASWWDLWRHPGWSWSQRASPPHCPDCALPKQNKKHIIGHAASRTDLQQDKWRQPLGILWKNTYINVFFCPKSNVYTLFFSNLGHSLIAQ